MTAYFQKPQNLALCILSILWVIISVWFGVNFALGGNFLSAAIMALFGGAAIGLWFQSRFAARILIACACFGIILSLLKMEQNPWLRTVTSISWAVWSIMLLVEFLKKTPAR